jgi:hypothetical protein
MSGMSALKVEVMHKTGSLLRSLFLPTIAAVLFIPQVQAQPVTAETPQTILSAQIRTQGFTCDKALGASRDNKRSRPDRPVWVLKCSNATYRVSRIPDMAAKVEPLP